MSKTPCRRRRAALHGAWNGQLVRHPACAWTDEVPAATPLCASELHVATESCFGVVHLQYSPLCRSIIFSTGSGGWAGPLPHPTPSSASPSLHDASPSSHLSEPEVQTQTQNLLPLPRHSPPSACAHSYPRAPIHTNLLTHPSSKWAHASRRVSCFIARPGPVSARPVFVAPLSPPSTTEPNVDA
ncbi:hypothetical protein J1614_010537 [Plenodomus biglobosus]|nr:hypothetical protein J1614_010537 [Plenodomus biglobosus]